MPDHKKIKVIKKPLTTKISASPKKFGNLKNLNLNLLENKKKLKPGLPLVPIRTENLPPKTDKNLPPKIKTIDKVENKKDNKVENKKDNKVDNKKEEKKEDKVVDKKEDKVENKKEDKVDNKVIKSTHPNPPIFEDDEDDKDIINKIGKRKVISSDSELDKSDETDGSDKSESTNEGSSISGSSIDEGSDKDSNESEHSNSDSDSIDSIIKSKDKKNKSKDNKDNKSKDKKDNKKKETKKDSEDSDDSDDSDGSDDIANYNAREKIEEKSEAKLNEERMDVLSQLRLIKRKYPEADISTYTEFTDLDTLKKIYKDTLKNVTLDENVTTMKTWIGFGFLAIEFIAKKAGLNFDGFAKFQSQRKEKYNRLLIELGEKSYANFGASWPVEIRLLMMILFDGFVFYISKMLSNGNDMKELMSMFFGMNNTNNNTNNSNRGPSISVNDVANIK